MDQRSTISRQRSRKGFTIIELLVVLTLLALLGALLLPATSRVKDQRTRAQCAINLKQIGMAMTMFAGENQDNLPFTGGGAWAFLLPHSTGDTMLEYGLQPLTFYCPGTSPRFTEQDNMNLWNYSGTYGVAGYAFTSRNGSIVLTNQNLTLTPKLIKSGPTVYPPPLPSQRVLNADATISDSGQYDYNQRYSYNWTKITGAYTKSHISPHLNGNFPAGGNLGMLDGHVEWRAFDQMLCRVNANPGFWW